MDLIHIHMCTYFSIHRQRLIDCDYLLTDFTSLHVYIIDRLYICMYLYYCQTLHISILILLSDSCSVYICRYFYYWLTLHLYVFILLTNSTYVYTSIIVGLVQCFRPWADIWVGVSSSVSYSIFILLAFFLSQFGCVLSHLNLSCLSFSRLQLLWIFLLGLLNLSMFLSYRL